MRGQQPTARHAVGSVGPPSGSSVAASLDRRPGREHIAEVERAADELGAAETDPAAGELSQGEANRAAWSCAPGRGNRHRVRGRRGNVHHLLLLAGHRTGHDRETERAHALCQKLLSFAGPLQLYADEIDTMTGQHLGNFPQAFTHLALTETVSLLIASEPEGLRRRQAKGENRGDALNEPRPWQLR